MKRSTTSKSNNIKIKKKKTEVDKKVTAFCFIFLPFSSKDHFESVRPPSVWSAWNFWRKYFKMCVYKALKIEFTLFSKWQYNTKILNYSFLSHWLVMNERKRKVQFIAPQQMKNCLSWKKMKTSIKTTSSECR